MTPKELLVKINELQSLMIDYANNIWRANSEQSSKYQHLFIEIDYELSCLKLKNPNRHVSLEGFLVHFKKELHDNDISNEWYEILITEYVKKIYSDTLMKLYRMGRNIPLSKNWEKANDNLKDDDDLDTVRKNWVKARNFIYASPPDFENSIKESVNSIESCLKIKMNEPKRTLGQLIKKANIDRDIQEMISATYGRVSNKDHVRHGGVKDSELGKAEAEFFLDLAGISINYIVAKFKK